MTTLLLIGAGLAIVIAVRDRSGFHLITAAVLVVTALHGGGR